MNKIGAFELVDPDREKLKQVNPYLVAHFYYGQGEYSEWTYDPVKKIYEHRNGDIYNMSRPHHTFDTVDEMYYTMRTCIGSCCCPNDDMKKERMDLLNNLFKYI